MVLNMHVCVVEYDAQVVVPLTHLDCADPVHEHELRGRLSRGLAAIGLIPGLGCRNRQPRRSASHCKATAVTPEQGKYSNYLPRNMAHGQAWVRHLGRRLQRQSQTKTALMHQKP